jgi:hypothetical protein
MAAEVIEEIKAHLEFLGFSCSPQKSLIFATHPSRPALAFRKFKGGIFFFTGYSAKKVGIEDRSGFLEFVNRANKEAAVARFVAQFEDDPGLMVEGWYPNVYDRETFGAFFDSWTSGTKTFLEKEAEATEKYLE